MEREPPDFSNKPLCTFKAIKPGLEYSLTSPAGTLLARLSGKQS